MVTDSALPLIPSRWRNAVQREGVRIRPQADRPQRLREIRYQRTPLSPHPRRAAGHRARMPGRSRYTVARYLLAGRPQPRIEDAVRIGELMRSAALSKFGWESDPRTGRSRALAPPEISGRDGTTPLRDAHHSHAFWLPEDTDGDGLIDHVCVYAATGFDTRVRAALDRLTRLWLRTGGSGDGAASEGGGRREWRLALEGFGTCAEFAQAKNRCAALGSHWGWHRHTQVVGHGKSSRKHALKKAGLDPQRRPHRGELRDAPEFIDGNVRRVVSDGNPREAFLRGFLPHFEALVGFGAAHMRKDS